MGVTSALPSKGATWIYGEVNVCSVDMQSLATALSELGKCCAPHTSTPRHTPTTPRHTTPHRPTHIPTPHHTHPHTAPHTPIPHHTHTHTAPHTHPHRATYTPTPRHTHTHAAPQERNLNLYMNGLYWTLGADVALLGATAECHRSPWWGVCPCKVEEGCEEGVGLLPSCVSGVDLHAGVQILHTWEGGRRCELHSEK